MNADDELFGLKSSRTGEYLHSESADEMLLNEGYELMYEDDYEIKYEYNSKELGDTFNFVLLFAKKAKMYWHKDNNGYSIGITAKLNKAINEKVKELKWNE